MNLLAEAPEWVSWSLAALLVLAAVQDAVQLRISNLFPLTVLGLALIAMAFTPVPSDIWQNLLVFAGLLAGGTALFAAGKLGGGDVKLLAATGVWTDLVGALTLLASVFICGGLLALMLIAARTIVPAQAAAGVKVLQPRGGIPYGVAIAAGALVTAAVVHA